MKKFFLVVFFMFQGFFTKISPFDFKVQENSFCTTQEFLKLLYNRYDNGFRLKNIKNNFLWHLSLPSVGLIPEIFFSGLISQFSIFEIFLWDLAPKKGKGVKIVILDTNSDRLQVDPGSLVCKNANLASFLQCWTKTMRAGSFFGAFELHLQQKNCFAESIKKNHILKNSLKINHAEVSYEIIKQLAPESEIILMPILDEYGFSNKQSLLQGLKKAFVMKADIVHLGLKTYESADKNCVLDKEIKKILKKFPYVVVAAGNDGKNIKKLAYPACLQSIFFSVGAFGNENGRYIISDFSQSSDDMFPNFVMPGKHILCPIWCKERSEYFFTHTMGTSIAVAMMSGFLALVLSEHASNFSKQRIMSVIKECSQKLDITWKDKVNLGAIHMRKTMMMFSVLKSFNKKCIKTEKQFFKSMDCVKKVFNENKDIYKIRSMFEEEHKKNVKNAIIYANSCFCKKIDRDLYILVQDSIYALKENIWKKKHI